MGGVSEGPIAHSQRARLGIPQQSYRQHVIGTVAIAKGHLDAMLGFQADSDGVVRTAVRTAVLWAATFHDLGKLDPENQRVLAASEAGTLPINHVDAGVAHLRRQDFLEAALAVHGHHRGLGDLVVEKNKERDSVRSGSSAALRDPAIKERVDATLSDLVEEHRRALSGSPGLEPFVRRSFGGLERRLALSCLVDADHTDTALHYGKEVRRRPPLTRWAERLKSLDSYVTNLGAEASTRNKFRAQVYAACRGATPDVPIWACGSPVGSGKTLAVMAYLLEAAIARGLRHVFVVVPFTNIIEQAVWEYRKALVLPGEDPAAVVAEHHHAVEFKSPDLRYLTTLWEAPIIVTTAVQFFETLAGSQTARIRKLHQLPGSAVFVDEAHTAMPIHLWPFQFGLIEQLAERWGCRFVLGSGSLARFWENRRIMADREHVSLPSMLPDGLTREGAADERARVGYATRTETLDLRGLCDWLAEQVRPSLVVMNTVHSAAVVARELRRRGKEVEHLSTAVAPVHREVILDRVKGRLLEQANEPWMLVATSCVEAGVDLSFGVAFRERCRASSLIQIGGRVNRHGERGTGVVWDFVVNDPKLTAHPAFTQTRRVVELLFNEGRWNEEPGDLVTYALEQEFKLDSAEKLIADLKKQEKAGAYPTVSKLAQLIQADTRLVVVDSELAKTLRSGGRVNARTLIQHSVQLWASKIENLDLPPLGYGGEIFEWRYPYDGHFLGVMEGMLQMADSDLAHCSFI